MSEQGMYEKYIVRMHRNNQPTQKVGTETDSGKGNKLLKSA